MLLKAENPKSKIDPKAISKSYLRKIHQIFIWSVDSDLSIQDPYSEPCQTSKLEIFAKKFILDAWQGSAYASAYIQVLINFRVQFIKGNKLIRKNPIFWSVWQFVSSVKKSV